MPVSPEDRGAILDLASRYCHTFDLGDPDGWAKCFTEDGVFEAPGRTLKGREELRKMAESAQFPAREGDPAASPGGQVLPPLVIVGFSSGPRELVRR